MKILPSDHVANRTTTKQQSTIFPGTPQAKFWPVLAKTKESMFDIFFNFKQFIIFLKKIQFWGLNNVFNSKLKVKVEAIAHEPVYKPMPGPGQHPYLPKQL